MTYGLSESSRQSYLTALGIPQFVARRVLPGAAASLLPALVVVSTDVPLLAEPAVADTQPGLALEAGAGMPVPVAAPVQPSGSSSAMMRAVAVLAPVVKVTASPSPVVPPEQLPVQQAVQAPAVAAPLLNFSCRLLQVNTQLAVLMDLGQYPDLGPQEQMLWRSICAVFAWSPRQLATDFSWPLLSRGMIANDVTAARDVVEGWLRRDLGPDMRLLVLGQTLEPVIVRAHRLLPGMADLLASPLAKRQLWHQLSSDLPTSEHAVDGL